MSARRLPLFTAREPLRVPPFSERVPTTGRCIAVADSGRGELALGWALELAQALAANDSPVPVVVTAFASAPLMPVALGARLAAVSNPLVQRALAADLEAARNLLADMAFDHTTLWLLVGEPALSVFDAPLTVLLGGETPVSAWPPSIRALRSSVALELSYPRPAVAHRLAEALLTPLSP